MDKDQELSLSQSLFEAVSKGRIAEVRERLGRGDCDINSFHMMSRTALHIAATKCNVDAVRLLLEFNADVKVGVYPTARHATSFWLIFVSL